MAKRPGIMIKTEDDKKYIVYNDQPLAKDKDMIVMHLIGDDFKPIKNDEGRQKTKLMKVESYNEAIKNWKLIGHID